MAEIRVESGDIAALTEQAVLAAILIDPATIGVARRGVLVGDFERPAHQRIYAAMLALADFHITIDPLTLADQLARRGELEAIGGKDYIGFLVDAVPTAANVEYHVGMLVERAKRRALAIAGEQLRADALAGKERAVDIAGRFVAGVQPIVADDPRARRRRLVAHSDLELEQLPPMEWLVEGVLPLGGTGALFGAPGAGKSFAAIDLAFSVALGIPWMGHPVLRGGTLYIAGEGKAGIAQRIRAWKLAHGVDGQLCGVCVMSDGINLLEARDVADVIELARDARLLQPLRLVVIDTLARSMVGDENDTREMSAVIAAIDRIRNATGACALPVHHTKKDSPDTERGSSALRGAVDTLILCQETDAGRQLSCVKQKDAEPFSTVPFQLVAGHGSCVVASTGSDSPLGSTGPGAGQLTPHRLKALRVLADAFTDKGATTSEWLRAADLPERTYYHIRTWLVREGYVLERGSRYVLSPSGRSAIVTRSTANGLQSPLQTPFRNPPKGGSGVAVPQGSATATATADDDGYYTNLLNDVDRREAAHAFHPDES